MDLVLGPFVLELLLRQKADFDFPIAGLSVLPEEW
jgi:hypothetical protein